MTAYGWRTALLVLAAILAVITVPPHLLLLRRRPPIWACGRTACRTERSTPAGRAGAGAADPATQALRERSFWWLALAFATSTFAGVALTVYLITYLQTQGHTAAFAATVAGLFGLMSLVGRLVLGPLGDRYARQHVTVGLLGLQLAGWRCWCSRRRPPVRWPPWPCVVPGSAR